MLICYHGTKADSAKAIRAHGFRVGTYFARHLEDALGYGGEYIFEVAFENREMGSGWQFTIAELLPPDRIVKITRVQTDVLYENKALRKRVFESDSE